MPNYFANWNSFVPHKKETDLPKLDVIRGMLESCETRNGNNSSGCWVVVRLKRENEFINVFFNSERVDKEIFRRLNSLKGTVISLRSENEKPVIADTEDVESIQTTLVKAVAAGNLKMEDLPALLEFSKGNDLLYEKWQLFKRQLEYEGLAKTMEEVSQRTVELKSAIDQETDKLVKLKDIYKEVSQKRRELIRELDEALTFMQGEDYPHGSGRSGMNGYGAENLVMIKAGYHNLLEAIERFRPQKGIFVICGNKLHKIHHAYLEDKGRVFLLGSAQEFNRHGGDESHKIVDRILPLL